MNIALKLAQAPVDKGTAQLLAILQDCNIDKMWEDENLRLLEYYLTHCTAGFADIREAVGHDTYLHLIGYACRVVDYNGENLTKQVLHWILQHADGAQLKKALRLSVLHKEDPAPLFVTFDKLHPSFARDQAEFSKMAMLLMCEDFPTCLYDDQDCAISLLTCYELLVDRNGDAPVLRTLRRSIMRKELHAINDFKREAMAEGKVFQGKTSGAKKYLTMTSYDRLRLMRYYKFEVEAAWKGRK